jgi:hypothetical protein
MNVAEQLLALCNEFYSVVTPWEQKRNAGLNLLMRKVKKNIENGLEGFNDDQELKLVKETLGDLDELIDQVSEDEKKRNPSLKRRFNEIQEQLANLRAEMLEGASDSDSSDGFGSPYYYPDLEEDFDVEDDSDDDEIEDEDGCDEDEDWDDEEES